MLYSDLLAEVHGQIAVEWGVAARGSGGRGVRPLDRRLAAVSGYSDGAAVSEAAFRLVILSNVDRASFQATNARLGVAFDAIYTAQDIGSYKPDPRNFRYLLDRLREQGVAREQAAACSAEPVP